MRKEILKFATFAPYFGSSTGLKCTGHGSESIDFVYLLDLSVSQEANGGFVGVFPEFSFGQVQRIVELDNWVELSSQSFKVSLGFLDGNGSTVVGANRSESRSGGGEGKEDSRFHFVLFSIFEKL